MTNGVAIIGAGISGLTTAHALQARGTRATIFEASDRVGGPIRTVRRDGFMAECGPHTFMESAAAVTSLIEDLGLTEQRVYASAASSTRYMVRDGEPRALPHSPPALLRTNAFSARAKLALLREPFVPRREDGVDESVTMFMRRRLDDELLDYGLELLVNGVWAGDPQRLSARYAFPKMYALERDHGSLLRGAVARARSRAPRARMFSFKDGNDVLCRTLADRAHDLRLETPVRRIASEASQWRVDGEPFDAVVSTVGVEAYPGLTFVCDDEEIEFGFMDSISAPPVAVLTLGFRASEVDHALDGFGMIAPIREGLDVLGVLFMSSLFEGRAPEGHVTLACFVGGVRRPELARLAADERLERVLASLQTTLGVRGRPTFVEETVYERAIPQYEVGYGRLLAEMEAVEHRHRGLFIRGNISGSVSVPDLIAAADELGSTLARSA